jgi:hypothetical protein
VRRKINRSPRLLALIERRKKVRKGEQFNADEMAAIAGMTWRNLKPQVDEDPAFPIVSRGSEGKPWVFDGRAVLDHMIARLELEAKEQQAREERVALMAGISPDLAASGMSVADLVKIDQLQTNAQRRKIEQGEYVRRDDAENAITGMFTTMQSETLATVSRLDPAGQWPPEVRAAVADALRTLLVRVHNGVSGWLKSDAGSGSETRRTVSRARGR